MKNATELQSDWPKTNRGQGHESTKFGASNLLLKKIPMARNEMNGFLNLAILKWISKIPGFLARNWFLYTDSTCHA